MRGRKPKRRNILGPSGLRGWRIPGGSAAHAAVGNQSRALGEVARFYERSHVDGNEVAVGDELRAVGVHEAPDLAEQMDRISLRLQPPRAGNRRNDRDVACLE